MNNLQTGKPHQVLLLDQDASVRDLMAEVLRDENYLVPDHDYSLNTDVIQDLQPDLIVLDLPKNSHGPQLDFVQGVKAHARTAHIPILGLCRLMPVNDYCAWMSQTGIARLLHKPFDLDDFLDAVRSCIEGAYPTAGACAQQASLHRSQ